MQQKHYEVESLIYKQSSCGLDALCTTQNICHELYENPLDVAFVLTDYHHPFRYAIVFAEPQTRFSQADRQYPFPPINDRLRPQQSSWIHFEDIP